MNCSLYTSFHVHSPRLACSESHLQCAQQRLSHSHGSSTAHARRRLTVAQVTTVRTSRVLRMRTCISRGRVPRDSSAHCPSCSLSVGAMTLSAVVEGCGAMAFLRNCATRASLPLRKARSTGVCPATFTVHRSAPWRRSTMAVLVAPKNAATWRSVLPSITRSSEKCGSLSSMRSTMVHASAWTASRASWCVGSFTSVTGDGKR
mmetsp:Transcript_14895/g.40108  ORF Transcript_14895/g.40108 Transcript_14895/m.40108 type:complete len:204 (+) Transcript_14895:630-1241(+)